MPRRVTEELLRRDIALLAPDMRLGPAVDAVVASGLPALPVATDSGAALGVFGEREFIAALFPGYVRELGGAGFIGGVLDDVLEKRLTCVREPVKKHMTADHVTVDINASDVHIAEIFLHHRVLIVPVYEHGRVAGVVTRSDFFRALAGRLPREDS